MDNKDLFTAALQLEYPWKVSNVELLPVQYKKTPAKAYRYD